MEWAEDAVGFLPTKGELLALPLQLSGDRRPVAVLRPVDEADVSRAQLIRCHRWHVGQQIYRSRRDMGNP